MIIGIDLLWVRPNICGGTESVIRNLLNGFGMYDDKNEYLLFAGRDVAETFECYKEYPNMRIQVCDVDSMKRVRRIAWENANLDKLARKLKVEIMLIPVYSKPNSLQEEKGGIPYITVIHDLQALHFPEYFSASKRFFAKKSWKKACAESRKVITISEFCKEDIIKNYPSAKEKCVVVYDPILLSEEKPVKSDNDLFENIKAKYNIEKDKFFYTVSSMLPHKNLETLINVIKEIKENEPDLRDYKLVVSGVGGKKDEFNAKVKEAGVEDLIVDTGFVSNEDRDALYENCNLFLFPSTFEGFGMPPVEAMMKGARVVTTKCTCLEEVTQKKATYVDDPRDVNDWIKRIKEAQTKEKKICSFPEYNLKEITEKYMDVFSSIIL